MFKGIWPGRIAKKISGNNGFGYDPVFLSDDLGKSFGVSTSDEKKSVSHRGRAFKKLMEKFDELRK